MSWPILPTNVYWQLCVCVMGQCRSGCEVSVSISIFVFVCFVYCACLQESHFLSISVTWDIMWVWWLTPLHVGLKLFVRFQDVLQKCPPVGPLESFDLLFIFLYLFLLLPTLSLCFPFVSFFVFCSLWFLLHLFSLSRSLCHVLANSVSLSREWIPRLPWSSLGLLLWAFWPRDLSGQPSAWGECHHCRCCQPSWWRLFWSSDCTDTQHCTGLSKFAGINVWCVCLSICAASDVCVLACTCVCMCVYVSLCVYVRVVKRSVHVVQWWFSLSMAVLCWIFRCSGDWTRSWLNGSTFPLSTGCLVTASTCGSLMISMTVIFPSLYSLGLQWARNG